MSREAIRSGFYGLLVSVGVLWILTIILYFVTDHHFKAYLEQWPVGVPISMFDIHPKGLWAFGIFATILFSIHWILSILFGKGKVAAVKPANTVLALYYFVLSFTILEVINQDYYHASIFCADNSTPRIEFDISWPCQNAYYVENTLGISMVLIVIASLIARVILSRKANNKS